MKFSTFISVIFISITLQCGPNNPSSLADCTSHSNNKEHCCLSELFENGSNKQRVCVSFERNEANSLSSGNIFSLDESKNHKVSCKTSSEDNHFFDQTLCGAKQIPSNYQSCTDAGTENLPCCYLEYSHKSEAHFPFQKDGKMCLQIEKTFLDSQLARSYFRNATVRMVCDKKGLVRSYKANSSSYVPLTIIILLIVQVLLI